MTELGAASVNAVAACSSVNVYTSGHHVLVKSLAKDRDCLLHPCVLTEVPDTSLAGMKKEEMVR